MKKLTPEEFQTLKPAVKLAYIESLVALYDYEYNKYYDNNPNVNTLSAFIWIELVGNDPITKAFTKHLNKNTTRIFKNYRGSKIAWYQGSQQNKRVIGAIESATLALSQYINCFVCADLD
jgi:ribonuclease HIII